MPGPASILRELHRLLRHATDLRTEIDRGPRVLKAKQSKAAEQEEAHRQAQENIKKLKVATHEKEVTLKGKNQQIAKYQQQLNEAGSKKEYDALQAEITSEKKACQKLEDQILDQMGETEALIARLPEFEKAVQKAKDEAVQVINEIQAKRNELTDRLNETNQKVKEMEASLSDDLRSNYERLLAAKGDSALSVVNGRTCAACYTDITAQNFNELTMERFVACKSCGRILYLPE